MKKFALLGYPLGHSKSKILHEIIMDVLDIQGQYDLIESQNIEKDINKLFDYDGFNITIPYKEKIIKYLNSIDKKAKNFNSINTVLSSDKIGYNTDVLGFLKSLELLDADKISSAVVAGCGGVSKTICHALCSKGVHVGIFARNKQKAEILVNSIKDNIEILNSENDFDGYDLFVNATPVGMFPDIDGMIISENAVKKFKYIFDTVYNPFLTKLVKCGIKNNIPSKNGIDMLIYQAIYAQEIWNDIKISNSEISIIRSKFLNKITNDSPNVVLCGFMGCGKSTIGKKIADILSYEFIDLDKVIVEGEKMSIPEIFEKYGDDHFRKLETEYLKKVLNYNNIVLSVGGGTILSDENAKIADKIGKTVFIDVELKEILKRIKNDKNRPLAKNETYIKNLFYERYNTYKKNTKVQVKFNSYNITENATLILKALF